MSNIKREHKVSGSVTILAGQTASEGFATGGWAWGRVYLPAGFEGTALAVEDSYDGALANFGPANDNQNSSVALTVAAGQSYRFDGAFPAHTMRLVADVQAADRVIFYELIG